LRQAASFEPFTEAQLWRHLKPNRLVPTDGKIAAEARRVAGGFASPLLRSRLLYDHIVETVSYDKSGTGWGRGDAIYACDIRKGNCTDFHSLYIAEARSLGIPARFIMGLPLDKRKTSGQIDAYHCWAEFYVTEKGWLPIDASEAHRNPENKEDFYGALDEHRIAFTVGRDIQLPGAASEPVNFAIYPHVEVDGTKYNNVETILSFADRDD
jgi:transglutaminase-like putative cysteine protease